MRRWGLWEVISSGRALMNGLTPVFQLLSRVQICDPTGCSMSGFPILHYLPKIAPTHIYLYPTISSSVTPFSSCPQSFPTSGSFPMNQFFASGTQSIGASASTSALPMNIPLSITSTCLIHCQPECTKTQSLVL